MTGEPADLLRRRRLAAALAALPPPDSPPQTAHAEAGVAVVLSFAAGPAEVLLMRRAEHPQDPWSGQVSFPGGRREAGDADTLATAIRETREELGLDLTATGLLGRLPAVQATARGRLLPLQIHPWVFAVEERPCLHLGPEAAAAFWLPLALAASGRLDARHTWTEGGRRLLLPAWRWQGQEVWGLTWRMLRVLLAVAGLP